MQPDLQYRLEMAETRAAYWKSCCERLTRELQLLQEELKELKRGEITGLEVRGG